MERVKSLTSPDLSPESNRVARLHLQWMGLSRISGLEAFESAEARCL